MANTISENNKALYLTGGALTGAILGAGTAHVFRDKLLHSKDFLTTRVDSFVLSRDPEFKTLQRKYDDLFNELDIVKNHIDLNNYISSKNIKNIPQDVLDKVKNSNFEQAKTTLKSCLLVDFHHDTKNVLRKIPDKKFHMAHAATFALLGAAIATPIAYLIHKHKN